MATWQDIEDNILIEDRVLIYDPDQVFSQPGTLSIHRVCGKDHVAQTLSLEGNKLTRFSPITGVSPENVMFTSDDVEEAARNQMQEAIAEAERRNVAFDKWIKSMFPIKEPKHPAVDAFGCWYAIAQPGYPCVHTFALLTLDDHGNLLDENGHEVDTTEQEFAVTYLDENLDAHIDNIIAAASPFLCY